MKSTQETSLESERIDRELAEFEKCWSDKSAYLPEFITRKGLDDSANVIGELIRADIDFRYTRNESDLDLQTYWNAFPRLLDYPKIVLDIAYEDFRARESRGLSVPSSRWSDLPGVASEAWFIALPKKNGLFTPTQVPADGPVLTPHGFPREGDVFAGFQLVKLLGEGAFSRVYLAIQPSLANRYVALKIVKKVLGEAEHLARLQHIGIVPLYSMHRSGNLTALCMPYSGSVTLAEWLRGSESSHRHGRSMASTIRDARHRLTERTEPMPSKSIPVLENVVEWEKEGEIRLRKLEPLNTRGFALWFATRVSAALAHAHERQILHGDIKPANVLLRNDGEPSLIDFNLSLDLSSDSNSIGGTLPYMSPEQLRRLMGRQMLLTPSSDVYSFGMVLYELIEGKLAFPPPFSQAESDLEESLRLRQRPIDFSNRSISWGLKSILRKCLSFDPTIRYHSAIELHEDIERERASQRLCHASENWIQSRIPKFMKRHPSLCSTTAITLIALSLILASMTLARGWWIASHRYAAKQTIQDWRFVASHQLPRLMISSSAADLRRTIQNADAALKNANLLELCSDQNNSKFQLLPLSEFKTAQQDLYDFLLFASAMTAERWGELHEEEQAVVANWVDHAKSMQLQKPFSPWLNDFPKNVSVPLSEATLKNIDPLIQDAQQAANQKTNPVTVDAARLLRVRALIHAGRGDEALREIPKQIPPPLLRSTYWMIIGEAHRSLGQYESALLSFGLGIDSAPRAPAGFVCQALLYSSMRKWKDAEASYTTAIELDPSSGTLWADRGRICELLGDLKQAKSDMDRAIQLDPQCNRFYLLRSRILRSLNQMKEARSDFDQAMHLRPSSIEDWISRGLAHLPGNPNAAIDDLKMAESLDPKRKEVLQNKAHIESDYLKDIVSATVSLHRLLEFHPNDVMARVDYAVLLARQGKVDEAMREIERLEKSGDQLAPDTHYQMACAYSQLSLLQKRFASNAIFHLAKALGMGYGSDLIQADEDLAPIRDTPEYSSLTEYAQLSRPSALKKRVADQPE